MPRHLDTLTSLEKAALLNEKWEELQTLRARERQWVDYLGFAVKEICTVAKPEWPYWSMFWILLHDLLVVGRTARPAVRPLRAELTRDELIMVDYLRHNHTHIHPGSFYAQFRKDGTLKEEVSIKTLGERLPQADVMAAVDRLHRAYGVNERRLALALAQRLRPLIPALREALRAAHVRRPRR